MKNLTAALLCSVFLFGCKATINGKADGDGGLPDSGDDGGDPSDAGADDGDAGIPDAGDDAGDDGGLPDAGGDDGGTQCPSGYGGIPVVTDPPIAGTWTLEFESHFLDDIVDEAEWKAGGPSAFFTGISGLDSKNISTECGYLYLKAEKRTVDWAGDSYEYVSGSLTTFKRFRQLYGYFEARIKYDASQGLWPAFWLMPDRGIYGNTDQNRASYLKFDLTGDPRTSVQSAVLELKVADSQDGVQNVMTMRVYDDDWSEDTVTYNTRPKHDPLWIEMRYDPNWAAGDTASFDVTEYVNQQLAGDKVVSLLLIDTFMRAKSVTFHSKEATNPADHPRLLLSGSPAEVIVTEDAMVGEDTFADVNMGSEPTLEVVDRWGVTTSTYDGGMEMDILESLGHWGDNITAHAIHWDGYGADHQHDTSGRVTFPATEDNFHVYGLNWQPGLLEFYVDGNKTWEYQDPRVGSVPGFVLLTHQMGGWRDNLGDGRIVDETALPGYMIVDYVRVWSGTPD